MQIQSRKEWLEYRQGGLGASDTYILLELTDWGTPLSLYESKIADEIVEIEGNFAIELGNEAEPGIRSLFELIDGKSFKECLVEMEGYNFLRASLDGRTDDKKELAEYKLLNKADWELAKEKRTIPIKYYAQIQKQLLVSNCERGWFVAYLFSAYKEGRKTKKALSFDNLAIVEVLPDKDYQKMIFDKEVDFWQNNVLKRKPPLPTDKDFIPLVGISKKVKQYLDLKNKLKELTEEFEKVEKEIKGAADKTGHPRLLCAGLKIIKISRAGSFSYAKVPEIKKLVSNMSTDEKLKYTGKGSMYWKISE